jgi:hypothetical protein
MLMMSKPCYDPLANWLIIWYVFVFLAIVYIYVLMGMVLTYGEAAWTDIHRVPVSIAFNLISLLVFIGDILVQINTGYIFRGVIVTDKTRVVGQYLRTYFIPDVLLAIIMLASIISNSLYLNIAKIIVVVKIMRMFDIDELYMRKISTNANLKIAYVIGKQFITIFILSHTIGLFFYAIDYALTNDPMCQENNSCKHATIKCAGCTRQLPFRPSSTMTGNFNTSILSTGESTPLPQSVTAILRPTTQLKSLMRSSVSALDL